MYKSIYQILYMAILHILCLIWGGNVHAQNQEDGSVISVITIDECYQWSRDNYPMIKQMKLIDKTTQYNLDNVSLRKLPQVTLNGQATYQSAVTEVPFEMPGVEIPNVSKDQYKLYGEAYQPLTHFNQLKTQSKKVELDGEIEKQKIEVDLYQLKDRINQMYFGILLIEKKIEQIEIIQKDLDNALEKINAGIENGTATPNDENLILVEKISLKQQVDESNANKESFVQMLSLMTGKNIIISTKLVIPVISNMPYPNNRPELQLFELQKKSIEIQYEDIQNNLLPNVGLFVQGGIGRPALNMLSNEFDPYFIGGLKLNWNLSNFYGRNNKRELISLTSSKIMNQKETFLMNTDLAQSQQSAEIKKLEELMESDREIIKIREKVLTTAKVQLYNGIITTIDYIQLLNDVNKARQQLLLHETQLLSAQYNLKTTTGN